MPHFIDSWGVRIYYQSWRVDDPHAIVQLSHGAGEHIGRYTELVRALNSAGYSVWADDHRGHGRTGFEQHGGDLSRMGRPGPGGLDGTIAAIERFTDVIRETEGDVPLVYLGHSWGSLMGQIIINRHADRYDGVVLSGTAHRTPLGMNAGDLNARFRHLGPSPAEWLTRDRAVIDDFMRDPYTTTVPLKKLYGYRDTLRLYGRPARNLPPELPLLILVGSDDALGGEQSALSLAKDYAERSGLVDIKIIVYEGARHEVFNEINRAEVMADLVLWLDERFAGD
ncbi:alpha/beta hydrolase [Salinibacterium hongtaonis]|uniref:Lysophospholipase n=1 Tax=Homoserinimonas hongtaonis TaxID=2079791 RepID=A0A2U1T3B0_9MICO|nr:alpha/beta hydrolase [Salinibacterium hongtaonis]PWB98348.1 lysophospholipase [Salinibacterium hongtaonis]